MQNALCNRYATSLILGEGANRFLTTSTEGRSGYAVRKLSVVAKTMRVMKLTAIIITVCCLSVAAKTVSQSVTYSGKDVSLETVFDAIEKQTGYFVVFEEQIASKGKLVSVNAKDMPLNDFLDQILREQPFTYSLKKTTITIASKIIVTDLSLRLPPPPITVRGRIVNEKGEPLSGVNVVVKGTKSGTTTNENGEFALNDVNDNAIIIISSIGHETREVNAMAKVFSNLSLKKNNSPLDEVQIIAYGETSKRFNTGNVSSVKGEDIKNQPVTSPLMALQGRVPGLNISPKNGVPGSSVNLEIRGRNSIRIGGGMPLYVIDGVPLDSRPLESNNTNLLLGNGFDPISTINPANIQSIEVLKDADATAIYGSRGANGVILITTKKGSLNETSFDISVYAGSGKVANFMKLLNREEYLTMRNEAFINAGSAPQSWDYDMVVWDTTRDTDWQKELLGGTSNIIDMQIGIGGRVKGISYQFGGSYHKEGMIFPGDFGYERFTGSFSLNHTSLNNKLNVNITANYGSESNKMFTGELVANALQLPPVAPKLYDSLGRLNWENSTWTNPLTGLINTDDSKGNNLIFNTTIGYELIPGLSIKSSVGYNAGNRSSIQKYKLSAADPALIYPTSTAASYFGGNLRKSWIVEPQINFKKEFGGNSINVLVGATWQDAQSDYQLIEATGYSSDVLLNSLKGATKYRYLNDDNNQYRYSAVFGRIGYALNDKYLLNLTGRRDGSSRFGSENRFGNFGALGVAWIFSSEKFIENILRFMSFGKIRASYGTAGNDQIGSFQYLSTYGYTPYPYGAGVGLNPTGLANPDYAWEVTKKLEMAIEVALLNDRVTIEASRYKNRSSNQLLALPLPGSAGFTSVTSNLNAVVENRGWEFVVNSKNIKGEFNWSTSVNFSIPKNELVSYHEIEESPYATTLVVGMPLNIAKIYNYRGVDPLTGLYDFEDINDDEALNVDDQKTVQLSGVKSYGGINNTFQYRNFILSFLIQFSNQISQRALPLAGLSPTNQPRYVLDRWKKPGDIATYQKYSTDFSIYFPYLNATISKLAYENSTFVRLKTIMLSYSIPVSLTNKLKLKESKFFVHAQNLLTYSKSTQLDPETGNQLPPLRMLTGGINIKL